MGYGVDSKTANTLRISGYSLTKLKLLSPEKLQELGLSLTAIPLILKSKRPPIPFGTLSRVLFANRWACCVCRNPELPIVVHHIKPWAKSRDHDASNLAVICSIHHGKVHTKHELELNLTPKILNEHKAQWELSCQEADARLALKNSYLRQNTWFYFNHLRIHEVAKSLKISPKIISGYATARKANLCDKDGVITKSCPEGSFLYSDSDRITLYEYVSSLFFSFLDRSDITNVSDHFDRGFLNAQLVVGDIILVQGLHTFTPVTPRPKGTDVSRVWRKTNGVQISSIIDLQGATSTSSWCGWLRGQNNICAILKVQKIFRQDGQVMVEGTALAIRSQDQEIKTRNYEQRLAGSGIAFHGQFNEDETIDTEGV